MQLQFSKKTFAGFLVALSVTVTMLTAFPAQADTVLCPGDVNDDLRVDLLDYSTLISQFFTSNSQSDLDSNGQVNIFDYSILASNFMNSCTTASPSASPSASPTQTSQGIWIGREEIMALPTSGTAWANVQTWADESNALPNFELSDDDFQSDDTNVTYLAKAMVATRTQNTTYRDQVVAGIQAIVDSNPDDYKFRALGLGRELGAYVIAADIIDLKTINPTLDQQWRQKLQLLRTIEVPGGPDNLIECSNARPNNWGGHCTASRLIVALYLDDQTEVANSIKAFKGWLGDRSTYSDFSYGELVWQCNPTTPVGINPKDNCFIQGHNMSGSQPEERRRAQLSFAWPPEPSTYEWEGLQGPFSTAVVLANNGYADVWQWADQALLRAVMWNYSGTSNYSTYGFPDDPQSQMNFPATGDDDWIPYLVNKYYQTNLPTTTTHPGKNTGFTDWTHS